MKKQITAGVITVLILAIASVFIGCSKKEDMPKAEKVVLTMGSWRADDVDAWTKLLAEYEKVSGVLIQFKPTNPPDYNASLRLQLDNGTGPDLMFARSYATGAELFDKGFFADLTNLSGLQDNFSESSKDAWRNKDGKSFGVPVAAVAQTIFYNKDIFAKEGIAIPATWEDLLAACRKLQNAGYAPFANGLADEWDITNAL